MHEVAGYLVQVQVHTCTSTSIIEAATSTAKTIGQLGENHTIIPKLALRLKKHTVAHCDGLAID